MRSLFAPQDRLGETHSIAAAFAKILSTVLTGHANGQVQLVFAGAWHYH